MVLFTLLILVQVARSTHKEIQLRKKAATAWARVGDMGMCVECWEELRASGETAESVALNALLRYGQ